jgi:hypothetical protein
MNQGGILSFTFSNSLRWATLEFQANAWLIIDEIQAFFNGRDISNVINYYILTPPTSKSLSSTISYPDNGFRLTDGVIAGMMSTITGWVKSEPHTIIIDLLIIRSIREASVWALSKLDWAVCPPASVIVRTSLDGKIWNSFGQMQVGERMLDAQRLFITTNNTSQARYIKFDFPLDRNIPGWWTMISEVTATD